GDRHGASLDVEGLAVAADARAAPARAGVDRAADGHRTEAAVPRRDRDRAAVRLLDKSSGGEGPSARDAAARVDAHAARAPALAGGRERHPARPPAAAPPPGNGPPGAP